MSVDKTSQYLKMSCSQLITFLAVLSDKRLSNRALVCLCVCVCVCVRERERVSLDKTPLCWYTMKESLA